MRRILLAFAAMLIVMSLGGCAGNQRQPKVLRIGYQKWGTFSILKASGELAKAFEPKGVKLEWIEFPAGPPLLEALNAGSIDIGHTGDSPPLFAQAADIPFVYFAASSASPESSGILVKRDSNIREAKDLRGRRVGFAKGTSAHTLVLHFVDKNGLSLSDIVPVYLAPADGRVALEAGSIDAWSIWDPYLAAAERQGGLRELSNGRGYVEGREFYLASKNIADHDPQLLREFLDQLVRVKAWAKARPSEVNGFLAAETGIELNAVELAESRRNRYDTESLSAALIASQQSLADRYLELGLLPKKIDVKADVLELKP